MTTINEASKNALARVLAIHEAIDGLERVRHIMYNVDRESGERVNLFSRDLHSELYTMETRAWRDFFAIAALLPPDKMDDVKQLAYKRFFADCDEVKMDLSHYLKMHGGGWLTSDEDELREQIAQSVNEI